MISNRTKIFSNAGLALAAALALVSSSCLHTQGAQDSMDLKVDPDFAHAQAESRRTNGSEPEYFEGDVAPAVPAALPEARPKAPSSSHVWIAGQHTRRDGKWVWVAGHYEVPPSADQVWVPGHWVAHLHGYAWIPGAWR